MYTLQTTTLVGNDYVPQRAEHVLRRGHTAPSAIQHLQLLDPDYGTVFHRTWKRPTYRSIDSSGC